MQKVISSADVEISINFYAIGKPIKIGTGASLQIGVDGNTERIMALGTRTAIGVDNGQDDLNLTLSLQTAEAERIMDAIANATAQLPGGAVAHIRQIIEGCDISVQWHYRRDVPPTTTMRTYLRCTGSADDSGAERGASETQTTWRFVAQDMSRRTFPM